MILKESFKKYHCEKLRHGYEDVYEPAFMPFRKVRFRLLEVGIFAGASLSVWLDFFPRGEIYGIDTFQRIPESDVGVLGESRVHFWKGDSQSIKLDESFDVIIDDGRHTHKAQRKTFENLFQYTDWYFIEDVWPFDQMTQKERNHKYLKRDGFSEREYQKLIDAVSQYNVTYYDLRRGHPDSFLIEVRR